MDGHTEKRKSKVSRHKKKHWRKHTDVNDIEEHLEEERREERTGGPTDLKSNDSLFFIDKKFDKPNADQKQKNEVKEQSDNEEEYVSNRHKQRERLQRQHRDEFENRKKKKKMINIWGQEVIAVEKNAFLDSTVKKDVAKPHTVGKGKLMIGAVSFPDAGTSYNPDYDSHQELLAKAHNVEVMKIRNSQKVNSKVKMVSVEELKKRAEEWKKEMAEGLPGHEEDGGSEDESEEEVKVHLIKTKKPKTAQQKRKAKLRKLLEKQRLDTKSLKRRLNDVYRVKSLKREIRESEEEKAERRRQKEKEEGENMRVKRLSKHKYHEADVQVQLSKDLTGSFRELKPEGNLLTDRFKSFQRRNIIETRRPVVPHRRYKRKVLSKRSYNAPTIKDFQPNTNKRSKR